MNILVFTRNSLLSGKSFGGAESSIKLIAKELNDTHSVKYLSYDFKYFIYPTVLKVKYEGLDHVIINSMKGGGRLRFIQTVNKKYRLHKLYKIINSEDIQLVYCHYDLKFLNDLFSLKEKGMKFKIMMRMAGMKWYEQCLKSPKFKDCYEDVFNKVDSINFIHPSLKPLVLRKFKELNMSVNIKHLFSGDIGTSAKIGRSISYEKLDNECFSIIMATRFSYYQKRQDILVKAISYIKDQIPIKILLIGDGPNRENVQKLINRLGLNEQIKIMPFLQQEYLWDQLESSDLLCHACEYEGLGKIIVESMSLGLPVLVSKVIPMTDYIKDSDNGFLVDNKPKLWAEKILQIYRDRQLRVEVSKRAINYIKTHYNPKKNIKMYESKIEEIL